MRVQSLQGDDQSSLAKGWFIGHEAKAVSADAKLTMGGAAEILDY